MQYLAGDASDAIAVNEALREGDELPEFEADADELDRVEAALGRVREAGEDPVDVAAALLFCVAVAITELLRSRLQE